MGSHGAVKESAGPLHVANNLCKDIGLSYLYEEAGAYDDAVLTKLNLDEAKVAACR